MRYSSNGTRRAGRCARIRTGAVVVLLTLFLLTTPAALAQSPSRFSFAWTSTTTVTRWSAGAPGESRASTTVQELRGQGTFLLLAAPQPGVAYAFDFESPEGQGSGFVLPGARDAIDPNFTFPTHPRA